MELESSGQLMGIVGRQRLSGAEQSANRGDKRDGDPGRVAGLGRSSPDAHAAPVLQRELFISPQYGCLQCRELRVGAIVGTILAHLVVCRSDCAFRTMIRIFDQYVSPKRLLLMA